MHKLLDILASGVHDAKNQLFIAESLIAAAEAKHGLKMSEARYAIEAAGNRLSRTLAAYGILRHDAALGVTPVLVGDLCEEVVLAQKSHLAGQDIALTVDCQVFDEWPLDRDLVTDMLNNAVQNAGRFARSRISLSAREDGGWLVLSVEDDGPGFATLPPTHGTGLMVADRLAALHARKGQQGSLHLSNGSSLGGARFELRLP
ncbi:MAG: signal transduction histidine kinase [Proteobacteria bacterium]|uniref:Signal transduction histidine kinase n=1 Tax=Dechloromonas aromatica (strain RCB) TaxID=159087 RepID=Q47JS6_DECAR|nr:signal transduction histidine kinase [Pseudomonadota bacterium]